MFNILGDLTVEQIYTECFQCGASSEMVELPYALAVFGNACFSFVKIIVPIILIVLGMIDMYKAFASQKDDEMKKAQQVFVKRLISAALLAFIVVIVEFLFLVLSRAGFGGSLINCMNDIVNGTASSEACEYKAGIK